MTAQQAIERANEMKAGNVVPDSVKLQWLTELDKTIYNDVILTHLHHLPINEDDKSFWWSYDAEAEKWVFKPSPEYTESNVYDILIAEAPHDIIYVYWLMAKIDLYSQELNKYNTDITLFDEAYQQYKNRYHRTHRTVPLPEISVGVFR